MKRKYILSALCVLLAINVISLVNAADTTYWLHNESDSQYFSYKQMKNVSADVASVQSESVPTDSIGLYCWASKWLAPNWTTAMAINGTWNFSIYTYSTADGVAYLNVRIFNYNSSNAEYNITQTQSSIDIMQKTAQVLSAWSINITSGQYTNLSIGERAGLQICANVTTLKAGGLLYTRIEQTTPSSVWFPNTTIIGAVDNPPNITALNYPRNNSYLNSVPIEFNFTVKDDSGFTNCTLYGNWSGGWHANQTIYNTTINNGSVSNFIAINISEGTYKWNVLCYDNSTTIQSDWYNENYTFIVDLTKPGFTLNAPANDTISQDTYRLLNVTVTDNRNEIIVKIYGGNETSFFNNNSLLYKRTGVANNTQITYNWTAPVLNVTSDTILLMHFDNEPPDNSTFIYDETRKNNGTKKSVNEPIWNESGKFGYALGFDGVDDSVTIPDSNSLDLNESFSISFWTYPTDLSKNQTFLAKGSGTTTNYYIDYKTTTKVEFGFYNGVWKSLAVDASTFTANKWNLITVTRNASTNISGVYINGVDKGSLQIDSSPLANSNALKLGSFPGYNQNFSGLIDELIIYNKTLTSSEVSNIYQLNDGNWYWRVDLNDTASNLNISETRVFTIGSIWTVSPTNLGSVGAALNVNVSVGTLTINNTHASRNVTINITHNYNGTITFSKTLPFNLTGAGGNWTQVQINVTSPATEGLTTIIFNITATDYLGVDSVPASRTVPVVLVTTSANPFLVSNFEIYPTVVSQNNTGIFLKASVVNRGQGNAQAVSLTFTLPSGWSNSSGALTQSLGIILVNEQKNASITANINSIATTGTVTLYANMSAQNSTGSDLSSSYLSIGSVNVTVNAISTGVGPTTVTTIVTTVAGGGGGGGAAAAGKELKTEAIYELVRGKDKFFYLPIHNEFIDIITNIEISVSGFLSKYISIKDIPAVVKPNSTENVTVHIIAPKYFTKGNFNLTFTITGDIIRNETKISFTEKRLVLLSIHELSGEDASKLINLSLDYIIKIENLNLTAKNLRELLNESEKKLAIRDYEGVAELHNLIKEKTEKALQTYAKIKKLYAEIEEAKKRGIATPDTERLLLLVTAALKREDYFTAAARIKEAELTFALETKGEFSLLYSMKYHPFQTILYVMLLGIFSVFLFSAIKLKRLNSELSSLAHEKEVLKGLIKTAQYECFEKETIDMSEYNITMQQYENRLNRVVERITELESAKATLLKPALKRLELERQRLLDIIKQIQAEYIIEGKEEAGVYKRKIQSYLTRLSEVEGKIVVKEAQASIKEEKRAILLSKFGIKRKKRKKKEKRREIEKAKEEIKKKEMPKTKLTKLEKLKRKAEKVSKKSKILTKITLFFKSIKEKIKKRKEKVEELKKILKGQGITISIKEKDKEKQVKSKKPIEKPEQKLGIIEEIKKPERNKPKRLTEKELKKYFPIVAKDLEKKKFWEKEKRGRK